MNRNSVDVQTEETLSFIEEEEEEELPNIGVSKLLFVKEMRNIFNKIFISIALYRWSK